MSRRTGHRSYAVWRHAGVVWSVVGLALSGRLLYAQGVVASRTADGADAKQGQALLARPVTVDVRQVSRRHAIELLAKSAHVVVQYRYALLDAFPDSVNVHVTNVPLGVALEQVLSGTGLRVALDAGKRVSIVAVGTATDSVPATGTVTGRVVDSATGRGLSGVTVKMVGTKRVVVTRDSGQFTLKDVPSGDVMLMARAFGYRPRERSISVHNGATARVRIALDAAPNVLSGVVTTATGQQRKVEVGNDITTVNADSVMRVAPVRTVTDLLETRVPGLTVVHSSGVPGAPSRLRLRGVGSAALNNDPIVFVDGVRVYASQSDARNTNLAFGQSASEVDVAGGFSAPSPLDQIDPNSIATIEVLKGPSATAIYGSDAGNGVIVITTKHGREGPAHYSLAASNGVSWLPGQWPTNYYRFGYNEYNKGPLCVWNDPSCAVDSVVPFQALNDARYSPFTHGNTQQANLSVSGGTAALTYSLTGSAGGTLGYLKLPSREVQRYDSLYGPIPRSLERPDRYTTWGVNGALTAAPNPMLHITLQSSLFKSAQQQSSLQSSILPLSARYLSTASLMSQVGANYLSAASQGPLMSREYERVTDNALTSTNAALVHWQPRPWLPLDLTGGINTMQRTDVSYVPFGINNWGIGFDGSSAAKGDTNGYYGLGRGTSQDNTVTLGTAIPLLGQKVTLKAGANLHSASTGDFQDFTNQLAPGVTAPTSFRTICNNGGNDFLCDSPSSQHSSAQSTYGWYLEPLLNVASKFFFTPGVRLDGGSGGGSFGGGLSGLSAFPKMNFSYLAVDREGERPLWGVLTQLRPRLAFGIGGTQPGPADKLRLLNVNSSTYKLAGVGGDCLATGANCLTSGYCTPFVTLDGVTQVPAVCVSSIGNTQLRPERSGEVEGGVEATLWQGRLSLIYTQYNKTRHDAILTIPIAPSVLSDQLGEYNIQKNIGVVRNTGTELTMTATVIETRAMGWTVGANYSQDNNRVVRLNKDQSTIVLVNGLGVSQTRVEAGYPLFGVFARPILSYADADHNGIIDPDEIRLGDSAVYVGQPNPKGQWTLTNDLSLFGGQLGVHAAVSYQEGMTQFNQGACNNLAFNLLPNTPGTSLATQAAVVAAACGGDTYSATSYTSGIGLIQVVNTLRFDYLTVNYAIPSSVSRRLRVPRMSVGVEGRNLGLHTNYRGFDPNVNAFSTAGTAGDRTVDHGQLPQPREWLFTLRLEN